MRSDTRVDRQLRIEGGILRPRVEKLLVGSRDCTKLVAGVLKQVGLVRGALDLVGLPDVPATGVLCFVEADWPLIGGAFSIDGVEVLWPKRAAELATSGSLDPDGVIEIQRHLAGVFLPA